MILQGTIDTVQFAILGFVLRWILKHREWADKQLSELKMQDQRMSMQLDREVERVKEALFGPEGNPDMGLVRQVNDIRRNSERNGKLMEMICNKLGIKVID